MIGGHSRKPAGVPPACPYAQWWSDQDAIQSGNRDGTGGKAAHVTMLKACGDQCPQRPGPAPAIEISQYQRGVTGVRYHAGKTRNLDAALPSLQAQVCGEHPQGSLFQIQLHLDHPTGFPTGD